jgi:hypothetical protein
MARTFVSGSSEYVGFTPRAWDAWGGGITVAALIRRNSTLNYHTRYYAGANGGGTDGNVEFGISSSDDPYFGTNTAAPRTLASTITAAVQLLCETKATGTATPTANFAVSPFDTWTHSNMSGTLANPATTASAIEEIGRWNGGSDYFDGDHEWVGIWGVGALSANQIESLPRLAPRFLPFMMEQPQRFWWFNQPISDNVRDLTNHLADQTARTGTTHTANHALMPNLAGTTFGLVPGVL